MRRFLAHAAQRLYGPASCNPSEHTPELLPLEWESMRVYHPTHAIERSFPMDRHHGDGVAGWVLQGASHRDPNGHRAEL